MTEVHTLHNHYLCLGWIATDWSVSNILDGVLGDVLPDLDQGISDLLGSL